MIITQPDLDRLVALLDAHGASTVNEDVRTHLAKALGSAVIVEPTAIPETTITMNSRVNLINIASGKIAEYELVFPAEADFSVDRVSVLAPLGAALLGRSEGDVIEKISSSDTDKYFIQKVTFQPESRFRNDAMDQREH